MARKCKCKKCGAQLTTDIAFKVVVKGVNHYYCNEPEYNKLQAYKLKRRNTMSYIFDMFSYNSDQLLPPVMIKKINVLAKTYDYDVIKETFKKDKKTLLYWWNLENKFTNEYNKVSYVMRIIENNINDTYKSMRIDKKQNEVSRSKVIIQDEALTKVKNIINKDISSFIEEE